MMFFWSYQYISHTVVAWRKTLLVCLNSAQRRLGKMLKGDQTLSFSILHYCLVYEEERFVNYVLICLKSLQYFALTAYMLYDISSLDHHIMEYKEKCTKKSNLALCITHELFIRLSWHYPQVWIVTPIFHIHLLLKKLLWQIFTKCRQIKGIYFLKKQILRQMMFRLS